VPPGSVRVEIRAPTVVGQRKLFDTPDSPTQDVLRETLPAKYNTQSELIEEIEPGRRELHFELRSSGKWGRAAGLG
jgi:hypothetical protein